MIVYMTPTATYTQSYLVGWSGTVTFHWNKGAPKDGVTIWYLPVLSPSKPPMTHAMTVPWTVDTAPRTYTLADARAIWREMIDRGFMAATEENA